MRLPLAEWMNGQTNTPKEDNHDTTLIYKLFKEFPYGTRLRKQQYGWMLNHFSFQTKFALSQIRFENTDAHNI